MQDLIAGERYSVIHPDDYWWGEVTVRAITKDGDVEVKDVLALSPNAEAVEHYFRVNKEASLNGKSDWKWELINFTLENE